MLKKYLIMLNFLLILSLFVLPVMSKEPVHDVEAVSQTASSTDVIAGDLVDIDVYVTNNGDFTETFVLNCYYDSVEIFPVTIIDLAPGETRLVIFTWDTTGVPDGTYSITAWADSGEAITEVDESNNWCTVPLEITIGEPQEPPGVPDLLFGPAISISILLCAYLLFRKHQTKKQN